MLANTRARGKGVLPSARCILSRNDEEMPVEICCMLVTGLGKAALDQQISCPWPKRRPSLDSGLYLACYSSSLCLIRRKRINVCMLSPLPPGFCPFLFCAPSSAETCQKHLADALRAERPRRLLEAIQQVWFYVADGQRARVD